MGTSALYQQSAVTGKGWDRHHPEELKGTASTVAAAPCEPPSPHLSQDCSSPSHTAEGGSLNPRRERKCLPDHASSCPRIPLFQVAPSEAAFPSGHSQGSHGTHFLASQPYTKVQAHLVLSASPTTRLVDIMREEIHSSRKAPRRHD